MEIFNSEIYGECPQPSSFNELIKIITSLEIDEEDKNYKFLPVMLWRGQSDINWKIDSAAYRRILLSQYRLENDENELRHYEKHLLRHAIHKGFNYHDGRTLYDLELLAKLQHHGAATRLVDFSRNALIALWFCINENLEKVGLLIGVHSSFIGGMEESPKTDSYDVIIKKIEKIKYPQVYESPTLSLRISAQHAQFLYSSVSNEITGSLQLPTEKKAKLFIAITPELKKECIEILEKVFDYRTKTLFPDLDGFGLSNSVSKNPDNMDRW